MMIDTSRLNEIFVGCLFTDEETVDKTTEELMDEATIVEGVTSTFGLEPQRVEGFRAEIEKMLKMLPEGFHKDIGGGMSFLNACMDKEGTQWGEHRNVEQLMVLGMALDRVEYCMSRELWSTMPGGLPYFVVNVG